MKSIDRHVELSNGYRMPILGFGTYGIPKDTVESVISKALEVGYRHIETAPIYMNEKGIGSAIRKSGIPREDIFITSKIPPHIKSYEGAMRVIERSMKNLGVDYLDAVLINNPVPWGEEGNDYSEANIEVYHAMEAMYEKELVGALGLSNFTIEEMEPLLKGVKVSPHLHQIGVFIGHSLDAIRTYSGNNGMAVQAHSPLARGRIFKLEGLERLAEKEGLSVAQLAIRFPLELNAYPIVKTLHKDRMRENINVDEPLSGDTLKALKAYDEDIRDYRPPGAKSVL